MLRACTTTIALCIEARDVDLIAIHNNVKALTLQIDAILFVCKTSPDPVDVGKAASGMEPVTDQKRGKKLNKVTVLNTKEVTSIGGRLTRPGTA